MGYCPYCGSDERLGVRLPKLKVRILDLVKAAGDIGISAAELRREVYGNAARHEVTIRAHIGQINEYLAETDWRIKSDGRGRHARWYLQRKATP